MALHRDAARLAAACALAALALAGCTGQAERPAPSGTTAAAPSGATSAPADAPSDESTADAILADYDLAGLDARQVIERLDTMPVADRPGDLIASIRPDGLVLTQNETTEATLAMPEGEFYLSIAPYVDQTHECHFHSLTTCKGEMAEKEVRLRIVDVATDKVIVDETRTTYDNGFVGVWVPAGIDAEVTVEGDGRAATQRVSTKTADDPTCITTMQLA